MRLKELGVGLLLAAAYMLPTYFIVGYTAAIDIPAWWYPTFGRTGPSAIAWMQIANALGMIAAAIPVAAAIAYFLPHKWLRMTSIAAAFAMAAMLYDSLLGFYAVAEFHPPRALHVVSALIDVVKVGLLLLLVVWSFKQFVPSNNALERP